MTFCNSLPLTYGHIFPYSERPGTKAAGMAGAVDVPVRKERAARLRKLVNDKKQEFLTGLVKLSHLDVLVQDINGRGVSEYYAACKFTELPDGIEPRSLVRAKPVGLEKGVVLVQSMDGES
jgi:tRNA A37 methylthiotransferase MiaB